MKYLFLLLITSCLFASKPDWVENNGKGKQYPEALYLTGFGISKIENKDIGKATQQASDVAKGNLIQKIKVNVNSNVISKTEESEQELSSYMSSTIQSVASMELQGLDVVNYNYDDDYIYALAVVKKEIFAKSYTDKIAKVADDLKQSILSAESYAQKGEKSKALKLYLSCFSKINQIEECRNILLVTGSDVFEVMNNLRKDEISSAKIQSEISKLLDKSVNSLDDVAWQVAYSLSQQNEKTITLSTTPITFQNSKAGSKFSVYFKDLLDSKLTELTKWNILKQASQNNQDYVLQGTYWEKETEIKLIINITSLKEKKNIASIQTSFPKSILKSENLDVKPQNFTEAMSDAKEFGKNEVIDGGLQVEAWTNKGKDGILYTAGEQMKVYLRVNMPCYVQFIYHQADGKRALLLNNQYIDESKVNKVYEIPTVFEASEPFGVEVLQVIAATESLPEIKTKNIDGVDIIDDTLNKVLISTRGMKKVKPTSMQAQNRITLTTMSK